MLLKEICFYTGIKNWKNVFKTQNKVHVEYITLFFYWKNKQTNNESMYDYQNPDELFAWSVCAQSSKLIVSLFQSMRYCTSVHESLCQLLHYKLWSILFFRKKQQSVMAMIKDTRSVIYPSHWNKVKPKWHQLHHNQGISFSVEIHQLSQRNCQ